MRIEYVTHGIGNNFGDVIELNENLKNYPELHKAILEHELRHEEGFTAKDFTMDISETKVKTMDLIKFIIHNPRALTQFLPFYFTKKYGFVYDLNLITTYAIIAVCIGLAAFISIKYF